VASQFNNPLINPIIRILTELPPFETTSSIIGQHSQLVGTGSQAVTQHKSDVP
jgi:hypothetical protein